MGFFFFDGLIYGLKFAPHRFQRTDADRWTDGADTPRARLARSRYESSNTGCPDDIEPSQDDYNWTLKKKAPRHRLGTRAPAPYS